MPYVNKLPPDLENVAALMERRKRAETRKEHWRSIYRECYRYAMPQRETFDWHTEGQFKETRLYDSTLQETTYTAANTLCALLFPGWSRWAELAFGPDIDPDKITPEMEDQLADATRVFFDYLNHSNFPQVINETALDLMVGTGALSFDEGDADNPFRFEAIPLAAIEIEEGPHGSVETKFMCRAPPVRHLDRMYPGLEPWMMPERLAALLETKPDEPVKVIQGEIYHPGTKKYYGVVVSEADKAILWRYDYGQTCPMIVARATKVAGELYGRGRVMLALSDARTLDRMQEFVLRHSALQVAPPMTGISDGVLNPYTAVLRPNVIVPVASNDSGNPSLRVMEVGGNFAITENLMTDLRARVRRTMLGPEPTEGPVRSATEVNVNDRNRLWAMGRIQAELLTKIVSRGVDILQRRGLIPKFKIDGKLVTVKYTSPFARSQDVEDALSLTNAIGAASMLGPEVMMMGMKVEDMPEFFLQKYGAPARFARTEAERKEKLDQVAQAAQAAQPEGGPQMAGQLG
jgi:Bacteriophage head to tail connecting protein